MIQPLADGRRSLKALLRYYGPLPNWRPYKDAVYDNERDLVRDMATMMKDMKHGRRDCQPFGDTLLAPSAWAKIADWSAAMGGALPEPQELRAVEERFGVMRICATPAHLDERDLMLEPGEWAWRAPDSDLDRSQDITDEQLTEEARRLADETMEITA